MRAARKGILAGALLTVLGVVSWLALELPRDDSAPTVERVPSIPSAVMERGAQAQETPAARPTPEERRVVEPAPFSPEPAAAGRSRTTLRGAVVDADTGAPIAGALVSLNRRSARTDVAGRYEFEGVVATSRVTLVARANGYLELERAVVPAHASPEALELALRRGTLQWLELFDRESGEPVRGAAIVMHAPHRSKLRADERGRVRLLVAEGARLHLQAHAEGCCDLMFESATHEPTPERAWRLPMTRPAWIELEVVDEESAPIRAFAELEHPAVFTGKVELSGEELSALELTGRLHHIRPLSRRPAPGAIELAVVPHAQPWSARVRAPGHGLALAGPFLLPRADERGAARVVLARAATLRVRVLRNGAPWRGTVHWSSGALSGSEGVQSAGLYVLRDLPPGELRIELRGSPPPPQDHALNVRLVAGEERALELAWEEELAPITGRVTGAAGTGLAGVEVVASRFGRDSHERERAETSPEGRYELRVASGVWTIVAERGAVSRRREEVPAGAREVDFALPDEGALVLELLDAGTSAPIPSLAGEARTVRWRELGEHVWREQPWRAGARSPGSTTLPLELPAGLVELVVDLSAEGYALSALGPVRVEAGGEPRTIQVALARAVRAMLRLRAADPGRSPVPAAHAFLPLDEADRDAVTLAFPGDRPPLARQVGDLWLRGMPFLERRALSFDASGRGNVRGLGPGSYVLRCFPDDLELEPERITLPAEGAAVIEVRWSPR